MGMDAQLEKAFHPVTRFTTTRLFNYAMAVLGPVGVAGVQFLLSFQLLHAITPEAFGAFAFLILTSTLGFSVSSALLCAPLPVLSGTRDRERIVRTLTAANMALSLTCALVFLAIGFLLGMPAPAACFFAAYTGAMMLRWFARTYAYVIGARWRTIASDAIYTTVMLCFLFGMAVAGSTSLEVACVGLFVAAALGLLPFGRDFLLRQFLNISWRALRRYGEVWRVHSKWSLTGVLTTEATANAHAYFVTFIAGSASFAPIAASALLIRPVGLATNALTDIERPQMARQLSKHDLSGAHESSRHFGFTLIAVWAASAVAATLLLLTAPRLLFPSAYDINSITLGVVLWFAIAGMRLWRAPQSALLQAAGEFRSVAHASYLSCGASIVVAGGLAFVSPTWSLVGILLGEAIFAVGIHLRARTWRAKVSATPVAAALAPDSELVAP